MITRKLGALLRGNATPAQMMMACVLGSILGFMPGFVQAVGLIVLLTLAILVLNANLALAGLVGTVAKLLSLVLMPLSFAVGRILLDGPTQGLFKSAVNAPVLALFGFEYYATTGGLALGLAFGVFCGILIVGTLRNFRRKMAKVEASSDRYQQWSKKWWVKCLTWILFGKGSKDDYADRLERHGKVVRPIGLVVAVLILVLLGIVQMFFSGPILTATMHAGLERANGATVDLRRAEVDLRAGRLTVEGLAVADPEALETDLLRAATVEIDLNTTDLWRKRITLDRVIIVDAEHAALRTTPGRLVGRRPPTTVAPPQEGEKSLEDYLDNAREWKGRLAQVRQWLEKFSGSDDKTTAGPAPAKASLQEQLKRQIEMLGYARVVASHLIEGTPTVTIKHLSAQEIRSRMLVDETINVSSEHLSTHPSLLNEAPRMTVKSSGGTLDLDLKLTGLSTSGGENRITLICRGLPVDTFAKHLVVSGAKPIAGGTIDAVLEGSIDITGDSYVDLPLEVTLHHTTVTVPGAGSTPVEKLTMPLGIRGPLDNPQITVDQSKLAEALTKAGAAVLAGKLKGDADKFLGEAKQDLSEKVGSELTDQIGDLAPAGLQGLFGGKKGKE